jgi:elongation factor 3
LQPVEAPTLAVLTPLLSKGLRVKSTPIIRKTAIIINNMSKLVFSPSDAAVFFPRLLPGLEKAAQETANPECRSVVEMAFGTLSRAATPEAVAEAEKPAIAPEVWGFWNSLYERAVGILSVSMFLAL